MPKPNISPLTFRPSEKSLAFVDELKGKGLTTTEIIEAALHNFKNEISGSEAFYDNFDTVGYVKAQARRNA